MNSTGIFFMGFVVGIIVFLVFIMVINYMDEKY